MILAGLLVCMVKGLRWALFGIPADKRWTPEGGKLSRKYGRWGFRDPRLDYVWAEQKTRPRGNIAHHLTDLIVEWVRLDAQRGAKLISAIAVIAYAIGVGVGLLL